MDYDTLKVFRRNDGRIDAGRVDRALAWCEAENYAALAILVSPSNERSACAAVDAAGVALPVVATHGLLRQELAIAVEEIRVEPPATATEPAVAMTQLAF